MADQPIVRGWFRGVVISTAAAAAGYLIVVLWVGRQDVAAALKLVSIDTMGLVLGLASANYALRFLRWHYYLGALGSRVPFFHDLRIYIGGFALTTTPGKAGEMARSLWLRPYGVPATTSLAAFLAERLQDFLAILLLSSLGLSFYHGAKWLLFTSLGLVLLAIVFLCIPAIGPSFSRSIGARAGRFASAARRLSEILVLTRDCFTPGRFVLGFLVGLCAWGAEAMGFTVLMQSLGHPLYLSTAISIYALSMLAGAVSFMPGGLGGSEASMIMLLGITRAPLPVAVSATLLIRLATLWFAVLLGIIALLIGVRMSPAASTAPAASTPADST